MPETTKTENEAASANGTSRSVLPSGERHRPRPWARSLTLLACACLLFSEAMVAHAQGAGAAAASGGVDRARGWTVHTVRGNRPLYRRTGEILVQYETGASRATSKTPGMAGKIKGSRVSRGDLEALTFDEDAVDFTALREQLLATPGVRRAEPNIVLSAQNRPTPLTSVDHSAKQWHLQSTLGHSRLLQRARALGRMPRHAVTRIGVIDTGVDDDHLEFAGRTLPGVNLISDPLPGEDAASEGDLNGHGTRVAGIIAAADDGVGVLGINPRAEICSIKAFNRDGDGYLEDIIAAIDWAIRNRMHVLNMSFGTYAYSELLEEAITRAQSAGILLVAAAGNDAAETAMYPAAFAGVLSVGAHDQGGWSSRFSNWGPGVDFHAPGDRILTTDLWGDGDSPYAVFSGTSAAAAYATGVASLLIEDGESAASAADRLRESVVSRASDYQIRSQHDLWLNARLIIARLLGEPYQELTIVSFETDRSIFAHEDEASIRFEIQNTGSQPTPPSQAALDVREGEASRHLALARIPRLLPGERHEASALFPASQLLRETSGTGSTAHRLQIELALDGFPLATHAPRRLIVSEESMNGVQVRALWVSPLDLNDAHAERTLYATLENVGREREEDLVARVYAVAAVHEGVGKTPKIDLGSIPLDGLLPGARTQLELPLGDFEPPEQRVTFWLEIEQRGRRLTRFLQGYQYPAAGGAASPEYAQNVHRVIADEAVKLLEAQGIYIEDLHAPGSIYRGIPSAFNTWPTSLGLPTATWSDPDYWTDADLATGAGNIGLNGFTLIDGAHDADGVDIAFGYSFEDNFDSHFWIVDNFDDDGLDSAGSNHHSALSKLRALFYGPDLAQGVPADNQLAYGAIDHYKAGYKQAAWWFVGHAVHLIGDVSVPSHVDDENEHGVVGATYHGWMDKGNYSLWDYSDALARGGLIDPFDPVNQGDPIRYLAYTTAQLGNAFPWAATIGTQDGADGNRTAGGDAPSYGATMQSLFGTLDSRPVVKWHVNKDEVYDSNIFVQECQLVDFLGPFEDHEDCWNGGDGHVDYDNTDNGGSNSDGDMARIGIENYPYAIRAAAGLIYYFAVQTGQVPLVVSNTNDDGAGSLRNAIEASPPGGRIEFDAALSGQTISLLTGQLDVLQDVTIDASSLPDVLTLTANDLSRIFEIGSGTTATIEGLTISGGSSDYGGGIRNNGALTLIDSTVSDNQVTAQGGGIYNYFGDLSLDGVTLSGNTANSQGGAIWAAGAATYIENSTIQGNQAPEHAGIVNENGGLTVVHSSIVQNEATGVGAPGGGISHLDFGLATTQIENSIVALNLAATGADVFKNAGSISPVGANLIGDNDTVATELPAGPLIGTSIDPRDPMLGALGDHGGPTATILPLPASAAVDAALAGPNSPTTDQRGMSRPNGPAADIGAVELSPFTAVDFSEGGALLQSGFLAQGTTDAAYAVDALGGSALMTVDLPTTTGSIVTRSAAPVFSSGSAFLADGTDIGALSADHFRHVAAGAQIEITLSSLVAGSYRFDGWWSDAQQAPGDLFQRLEVSTDGGSSFANVTDTIDPAGLKASPVSVSFAADGVQDVVIRVTENNASDELRLNAFAVPEPGLLWQLAAGLGLLGMLASGRRQSPGARDRRLS